MIYQIFFLSCLFCSLFLNAAAPLTHLFLAEKFAKANQIKEEDIDKFLNGSVFPDVRYISHISRGKTHCYGMTQNQIRKIDNPFFAGMAHHSYIDEHRNRIVTKRNVYCYLKKVAQGYPHTLLKFIEDEYLCSFCDPKSYTSAFLDILDEEYDYESDSLTLMKWHYILIVYLQEKPSKTLAMLADLNRSFFDIPPETLKLWSEEIPKLKEHPKIKAYMEEMFSYFRNREKY